MDRPHGREVAPIDIPNPVLRRGWFAHHDHAAFQEEVRDVEQSEKAVTSLVKTRTEKEKALIEHERALARREMMPGLIEQDRSSTSSLPRAAPPTRPAMRSSTSSNA